MHNTSALCMGSSHERLTVQTGEADALRNVCSKSTQQSVYHPVLFARRNASHCGDKVAFNKYLQSQPNITSSSSMNLTETCPGHISPQIKNRRPLTFLHFFINIKKKK